MTLSYVNTVALFFVYGLAFFAMGLAVALEARRSHSRLALSLRFLAAFGLLHGVAQWVVMFLLVDTHGATVEGSLGMRVLALSLSSLSALFLLQFGASLLHDTSADALWSRLLPVGLTGIWVSSFAIPPVRGLYTSISETRLPGTQQCIDCHWGAAASYVVASKDWVTSAGVWSRYLLFLPGSVLAAAGLAAQASNFRALNMPHIARQTVLAAGAFLVTAVVAGIVVAPVPYPPASVLNDATFMTKTGVPPQILWALSAAAVSFFVVRILNVFELERDRQLRVATAERLQAQEEALEARSRSVEAQRLAVLEERDRIAREMHDSLAQVLGVLRLKTNLASQLLVEGNLEAAESQLNSVEEAAEDGYREVRASILELRSGAFVRQGLVEGLIDYAAKFSAESGIQAEVEVGEGAPGHLPPSAETQLIRIIQEALANVRKHAGPCRAVVRLELADGQLLASVSDDGVGFNPQDNPGENGSHFGLQTMRERAESVGGQLKVESAPGAGTRVDVRLSVNGRGGGYASSESPSS